MRRPVVGVLGQRVPSAVAAGIGYGARELDSYASGCLEALIDAGFVPLGIPSSEDLDAARCCELVDALVLDSAGRCEELPGAEIAGDRWQAAVVREALNLRRPILSICRAFAVLAPFFGGRREPAEETGAAGAEQVRVEVGDPELRALAGGSFTVNVPHPDAGFLPLPGLAAAATAGGTVLALVGEEQPVLAVQWHPENAPAGDPAREGPLSWLKQRILAREGGAPE